MNELIEYEMFKEWFGFGLKWIKMNEWMNEWIKLYNLILKIFNFEYLIFDYLRLMMIIMSIRRINAWKRWGRAKQWFGLAYTVAVPHQPPGEQSSIHRQWCSF